MRTFPRKGIRRVYLVPGFLALLTMLLMGCGTSNGSANQLAASQVFTWPLIHVASFNDLVLDPANVADLYSASVTNAIYSGLVTTDHNLNVIPDLASSWEISPDGRTYTFHIRPNLHFSDGTPLTAQDFAYGIDRALDPNVCVSVYGDGCTPYAYPGYLGHIANASERVSGKISTLIGTSLLVPDAQTLVIKLDKPIAYFLEALTYPTSFPVEKSLVQKYGNDYADHKDWTAHLDEGGESGPFILKSYNTTELTLVPNPDWYGPKVPLKEIIRPFVEKQTDAYTAYQQGLYDYTEVPSQNYQEASDQDDFHQVGLLQTSYIGINQAAAPLNDLDLRQALALAINKQLIADRVLNGSAYPTNHIIPQGMPGFYDGLTAPGIDSRAVTGDVATARKLLENFFSRNPQYHNKLTLTLSFPNDDTDTVRVEQAIVTMWNAVFTQNNQEEITIIPNGMSFQTLVGDVLNDTVGNRPGALQMWMIGWIADYPDPQDWLSLQFAKDSSNNASNYQDGNGFTAQAIMAQADVEQNAIKRMSLYNQAEQQLVNDVAWLPYAQPKGIWRIRTYIQGFNPSALGLLTDIQWSNVEILAH